MIWITILLSFFIGILLGYQLPPLVNRFRHFIYRRSFRPVALKPYQSAKQAGKGRSAP